MDNYEQDLQLLKEQQKKKAIADLEAQQKQSLSNLDAELDTIKPIYYAKKDSANVQSQVASKNFAEYLANSGKSNSGIGAQYEMLRTNNLQRNLNDLNTAEASAVADVNRRKTDVNNSFQSGLTSATAQIELDYITNLLNQRQLAWEREQAEKEFEYRRQQDSIANTQAWARINASNTSDNLEFDDTSEEQENSKNSFLDSENKIFKNFKNNVVKSQSKYSNKNRQSPNLSSKNANIWFDNTIGTGSYTETELENMLATGIRSGVITQDDASKILTVYGL